MELQLAPEADLAPVIKAKFNIGACLDIPTGQWMLGKYGENILNGGFGQITGMIGIGNNFKSTLLDCMELIAMMCVFYSYKLPEKKSERVLTPFKTNLSTYDTEVNINEDHKQELVENIPGFEGMDFFDHANMIWKVTDKTVYYGDEYFEKMKDFIQHKRKNEKSYLVNTPFLDRDGVTLFKIIFPTFGQIDSISDFQSKAEMTMQDTNELGASGANTLHMKGGLVRTRLMSELPALTTGGSHYMGLTSQIGKEMSIGQAPGAQPQKSLQGLKNGDRLVGATKKFTYATTICWHATNATPLVDTERKAEYADPMDSVRAIGDTDLNKVTLTCLRNKNGPTLMSLYMLVSQRKGLQATLTEFHNIREKGRFGIAGSGGNYNLALLPDCHITRNTVRDKIDKEKKLVNAIRYTSEMQQMSVFHLDEWSQYGVEPSELYQSLKAKGYDWDLLLSCRPWWAINNDVNPVPFLSTLDLLKMHKEEYFPYWMTEDKKGIKPEFQYERLES